MINCTWIGSGTIKNQPTTTNELSNQGYTVLGLKGSLYQRRLGLISLHRIRERKRFVNYQRAPTPSSIPTRPTGMLNAHASLIFQR